MKREGRRLYPSKVNKKLMMAERFRNFVPYSSCRPIHYSLGSYPKLDVQTEQAAPNLNIIPMIAPTATIFPLCWCFFGSGIRPFERPFRCPSRMVRSAEQMDLERNALLSVSRRVHSDGSLMTIELLSPRFIQQRSAFGGRSRIRALEYPGICSFGGYNPFQKMSPRRKCSRHLAVSENVFSDGS